MPNQKPNFGTIFRIRDDRQAKALTGCNLAMLQELLPVFDQLFRDAIASRILAPQRVRLLVVANGVYSKQPRISSSTSCYTSKPIRRMMSCPQSLTWIEALPAAECNNYFLCLKLPLSARLCCRSPVLRSSTRSSRRQRMY